MKINKKFVRLIGLSLLISMFLSGCVQVKEPAGSNETEHVSASAVATTDNQKETASPSATATATDVDKVTSVPSKKPTATKKPTSTVTVTQKPSVAPSPTPTANIYQKKSYQINDVLSKMKLVGRSVVAGQGVTCDWTASGIEFTAQCQGDITLQIKGNGGEENIAYFTVYIDGVRQSNRISVNATQNKVSDVVIAKGLSKGTHSIRFLKQSYVKDSRVLLLNLTINGVLSDTAPANKKYFMEFIGDSITCGHGILGSSGNAVDMDGTATYAFKTAENLGADYSMVSVDGIGVEKGYQTEKMGEIYEYLCKYRFSTRKYDFARTPDIVVINLGTNDATKKANVENYKTGVTNLINAVRNGYGKNVTIIWAYNSMRADYNEHTKTAIDAMGGEAAGIYMVRFDKNTAGGNGHPSGDAHTKDARILTNFITQKNLLK